MSLHPDGGNYVASDQRNSTPELESFQRFFELWLVQQNNYLEGLISASKQHNKSIDTNTTIADKPPLQLLINQVIQHYEYFYQVILE
ncbi:hypothetical protein SO802_021610 [Lithocarpus litseifolius]|uniref:Uncharacterized protein n=1 Tax=Lithocarpus litseifolius TaxID=425828 RepID=A0AAW2CFA6_9ROSI